MVKLEECWIPKLREVHGKRKRVSHRYPQIRRWLMNLTTFRYPESTTIAWDFSRPWYYNKYITLAAILSANGEWNPMKTWNVNLKMHFTVFEAAREFGTKMFFLAPSPCLEIRLRLTLPKMSLLLPNTVYGISKASELWCNYYHQRYV